MLLLQNGCLSSFLSLDTASYKAWETSEQHFDVLDFNRKSSWKRTTSLISDSFYGATVVVIECSILPLSLRSFYTC